MYIHGSLLAVVVLRPCGFAIRSPFMQTAHKKRCFHATFLKTENASIAGPHHSVIFPICRAPNSIRVLCKVSRAKKQFEETELSG